MPSSYEKGNILGVWHLKDYGYGAYQYAQLAFLSNGRKCVVSVQFDYKGEPEINYYDNTWILEDDVVVTTVGKSPTKSLPEGYIIRDHIKLIDDNNLHLLMESKTEFVPRLEKHQKLDGVDPIRICEIVESKVQWQEFYMQRYRQ